MLIVGMGGTNRPGSSSETALRCALAAAERAGAETRCLAAGDLDLPMYEPGSAARTPQAESVVELLAAADGVVLASPGYHGSVSGLVKNALDYVEDLRDHDPCYFDGRAVGCIAVARGWQAANSTLRALRDIVHALRGWPTPYGAAINIAEVDYADGAFPNDVTEQLALVGTQVVDFARAVRVGAGI